MTIKKLLFILSTSLFAISAYSAGSITLYNKNAANQGLYVIKMNDGSAKNSCRGPITFTPGDTSSNMQVFSAADIADFKAKGCADQRYVRFAIVGKHSGLMYPNILIKPGQNCEITYSMLHGFQSKCDD